MALSTSWGLVPSEQFGKVICEPNWRWSREHDPFDDFDFWYVWSGEGEVTLNGNRYEIGQGDCFLFRPEDFASAKHNPERPLTVTFIHFDTTGDLSWILSLPPYIRFNPADAHEIYLQRFIQVRLNQAFGHEDEAALLLHLLLVLYERQKPEHFPYKNQTQHSMNKVMMDIAAHILQDPGHQHTIEELAKLTHLSPRYFSLKFKEQMGQTIESFIIEKRIERAKYLLTLGMNVGEVAEALGYRSIYFFSRQFKKVTGMNPSKLRS
ncbi:helix-turn-helix transcriptional regulator [Paenibacillus alba]|uniref:AraC family transcriptional regulator n=1 Tax=Paenibacillus alba TaxID=1197127 RepID=A0ABU6G716_9BACL|nr:AraC family transcriptional regulator [Paenibacillus alba]MEC0229405.1 AraC family transcriptional regulator [Paenibacillus alba]